jgi:hypothetical protein
MALNRHFFSLLKFVVEEHGATLRYQEVRPLISFHFVSR